MPVYNRERLVREAIDSVLAQTFAGFELVVVERFAARIRQVVAEFAP